MSYKIKDKAAISFSNGAVKICGVAISKIVWLCAFGVNENVYVKYIYLF
jgi:hypothetical protein